MNSTTKVITEILKLLASVVLTIAISWVVSGLPAIWKPEHRTRIVLVVFMIGAAEVFVIFVVKHLCATLKIGLNPRSQISRSNKLKSFAVIVFGVLAWAVVIVAQTSALVRWIPPESPPFESVAFFRHDVSHTGSFSEPGPEAEAVEVKWNMTASGKISASPVIANGAVFFGDENGEFYSVNAESGKINWSLDLGAPVKASAAVVDNSIYVSTKGVGLCKVKQSSKKIEWCTGSDVPEMMQKGLVSISSPIVVDDFVYFGTEDGYVFAVDSESGALRWNYFTSSAVQGSPTVSDGILVVGSLKGGVFGLDSVSGRKNWQFQIPGGVAGTVAIVNKSIIVGGGDQKLYSLSFEGVPNWPSPVSLEGHITADPAVAYGVVYVATQWGNIYAVYYDTGIVKWHKPDMGIVSYSSPIVSNNVIYVGTYDHMVIAMDVEDGETLWDYELDGRVQSAASVYNRVLYVGSDDHMLYALQRN